MVKSVSGQGVVGDTSRPRFKLPISKLRTSKRAIVVSVGFIAIVLAVVVIGMFHHFTTSGAKAAVALPTTAEYNKSNLARLEAKKLPAHATLAQKATYYDELSKASADSGDYSAAIKAFVKREQATDEGLKYTDYMRLAGYYHKSGDSKSAEKALTTAIYILPAYDNADFGYIRSVALDHIAVLQKEYAR